MTPALLALAAAVLLVCVCADKTPVRRVGLRFQDEREIRIYNTKHAGQPSDSLPSDFRAAYNAKNDRVAVIPNNRQYKSHYNSKDDRRAAVPDDHQYKTYYDVTEKDIVIHSPNDRREKTYSSGKKTELPSSCLYGGRWHDDGASVSTREDCLSCVCARGALSCRRRSCVALPETLPPHCHVRHRKGFCCPELMCPDGVKLMEHGASARSDSEEMSPATVVSTARPVIAKNACVEGGSVFAAGSALSSAVACEQCFCLRGARHCVRPSCLPPPPHCAPRPSPGACCPQRYYCDTTPNLTEEHRKHYDCQVDGVLVAEGSPVASNSNCSTCFCLRGEVRCQAMGCAPALAGCRPLLAPGECCAHQYICDHNEKEHQSHVIAGSENSPISIMHDKETFHSSKIESTTKKIITSQMYAMKHTSFTSPTKNHLSATTKVKRKTDEPPLNASMKPEQSTNTTSYNITTTQKPVNAAKLIAMAEVSPSDDSPEKTTEQPEGTVKIMINGTINCTAELSSTSIPLSIVANDTDNNALEVLPRIPIVNIEAQTYSPNDIITDRNVNGGFDEDDTFTINVTSSLMTNTSHSTSKPVITSPKIPADLADALNSSKKNKGEYDYDYTEPTLPPSLPNLKIIPFVAADAVVEDEPTKDAYPILEREDKFPVYYPTDNKGTKYPIRREDTYQPTQYPVFVMGKVEPSYPPMSQEVDLPRDSNPERNVHEYTVSASLGSHGSVVKTVTMVPPTTTTFAMETPAVNLFSPPVETEGGFLPKDSASVGGYFGHTPQGEFLPEGAGVIDESFGLYPSTPPGPTVPHLTTSMQLDFIKDVKGECLVDGEHLPGGQSIVMGCQLCTCSWVELVCEALPCRAVVPPCRRLPISNHSSDPCCGDVDCSLEQNTSSNKSSNSATVHKENQANGINVKVQQQQHQHPTTSESFASVPNTNKTNTSNNNADEDAKYVADTRDTDSNTPSRVNTESVQKTTTTPIPPAKPTRRRTTTSTTRAPVTQASLEDEDDDDDDSFSFGSVLQLLLSDGYPTTAAPSKKSQPPTRTPLPAPPVRRVTSAPATNSPQTETNLAPSPTNPFILNLMPTNTVNQIDHLVLGEATAIKRTTHQPITNAVTERRPPQSYERPSSQMYDTAERAPAAQETPVLSVAPLPAGGPRPPSLGSLPGSGSGVVLKLAGCNIYGKMYRVGRIILELSTPCMECSCTELGVQCKALNC